MQPSDKLICGLASCLFSHPDRNHLCGRTRFASLLAYDIVSCSNRLPNMTTAEGGDEHGNDTEVPTISEISVYIQITFLFGVRVLYCTRAPRLALPRLHFEPPLPV